MMKIESAMLISDWLVYGLFVIAIICGFWMRKQAHLREPWSQVLHHKLGMVALVILLFFVGIGLLDSIHLRITKTNPVTAQINTQVKSVLDLLISPLGQQNEKTYSAPFATHLFNQAIVTLPSGKEVRAYPRLKYGGAHLTNPEQQKAWDISKKIIKGFFIGSAIFILLSGLLISAIAYRNKQHFSKTLSQIIRGKTYVAWRETIITFGAIIILIAIIACLATHYHIFGTDKVGSDVFYETLNSIRTGLLIGTLTTLFMLPFALVFGTLAGYFGGWTDDVIQYLYTTLSSIPGVLLISASILVLQVYINSHPNLFPTLMQRADARLLALCLILGLTSWAGLCRLLRAETLKLNNLEYIQAAKSLGVKSRSIIIRHIIPNVMHIVLITMVIDFSGLVLAEAVLSYVGVGVDPTTMSWGNMINSSRLELAREPLVWWPLLAALIFMFLLVLSANIFSDAVRDAFDPKLRQLRDE